MMWSGILFTTSTIDCRNKIMKLIKDGSLFLASGVGFCFVLLTLLFRFHKIRLQRKLRGEPAES